MENETFFKAAAAVVNTQEGQAEVAASEQAATEDQAGAEMAVDQAATETIAKTQETEENTTQPSVSEPYNYWTDLDKKTEGFVKDEESLNTLLERAKSYETLLQEKEELAKNQFKPANDFVTKLNDLTLAGASKDQISAFIELNSHGDLNTLSPIDTKVLKLVLVDGMDKSIATKLVNREFNLSQFDETDPDQKDDADIMRAQLAVSAKSDLAALSEYKKELSVVHNPDKEQAEQARLAAIKEMGDYNRTIQTQAPNIAKHFPQKLDYEFKIGDDVVKYEDNIDKQFLENDLQQYVADYFKDSGDPINTQTIGEAYSFALGEYLKANDQKRMERAYQKGDAAGYERAVNKYENRSGLPKAQENQVVVSNGEGLGNFMRQMVGR